MVRAKYVFSGGPAASLAAAAIAVLGSTGIAACSASSGGGTTSDGGDDSTSYAMPETGGGGDGASSDGGGGGGGDASDAATCNIPAGATYSYDGGTGGFACTPVGPDPMCDSKSYLLRCIASDPYNNPVSATASLNCGGSMLTSQSVETEFCCACK